MIILPSQIFAEEGTSIDNDRPIDMYQQFSVEEKKQRLNEIIEIPLEQQKIRFEITEKPDVKVTHIIELGGWSAGNPRMIEILPGEHVNVDVTDKDLSLIHI